MTDKKKVILPFGVNLIREKKEADKKKASVKPQPKEEVKPAEAPKKKKLNIFGK